MKPNGETSETSGLLATIPLGAALAGLLRLAVSADRRDEFLGDLIEEAHLRRARCSRGQLAIWLWAQTLRSLPMLLGLRVRRLAAAATGLNGGWGPGARAGGGLLVATRTDQRGWPLSVAVSVSAHALVLVAALGWLFGRVDEVEPVRTPLDLLAAIVADASAAEPHPTAPVIVETLSNDQRAPARRVRAPRRSPATVSPQPAAAPQPGNELPGTASPATTDLIARPPAPSIGEGTRTMSVALPPRIAEKRCLTCPTPQLPPAYAHLARGQDMVIRTCVSSAGEVTSVNVVRGFDTTVNREVTATVRHWRMVPYLLNGHPVPFCYATRFIFASS